MMPRIAEILCPVDFSDLAQHAVDYAAAIARRYEARLTLLHVFVNLPAMDVPPLVLAEADREHLMAKARQMAVRAPSEVPLNVRVREAESVHGEILAECRAIPADLLVIGTHGRSGFQRLFLGSVTEKVIRTAMCPTLVVPPRAPAVAPDMPVQFNRMLCPVDFSESSLDALAYALKMAGDVGARLTLLHVVEIPLVLHQKPDGLDLSRVREAAVAEARRRFHELIPEQARAWTTVETPVAEGHVHREVLRHAADAQSDLIIMGARGRGALDALAFGSTTHHVVRASTCPVLIVRRTEQS